MFCLAQPNNSALPILRKIGAEGGGRSLLQNIRKGDTSMLKVWVGLEARNYLQASAEFVSICRSQSKAKKSFR